MRNPKDDPKFRKPRPTQTDDSEADAPEASIYFSQRSYSPPRTTQAPNAAESTRGRRSADARTLRRYGKTREQIDAFIVADCLDVAAGLPRQLADRYPAMPHFLRLQRKGLRP